MITKLRTYLTTQWRNQRSAVVAAASTLVIVVLATGLLLWINHSATATANQLTVVAAENTWGSIAAQVAGSHAQVISIITDPTADPHLYESDARDAAAVASARLVISNGLGYDDFMTKLLAADPNSQRHLISAQQVLHVTGTNPNPHLWYDLDGVPQVAAAIATQLVAIDPTHRAAYQANLARFDASLQPVMATVAAIRQRYAGTSVAYTERVPGYLVEEAGLTNQTPSAFASAIEDGTDPSPAATTAMRNLLTTHAVKVLLYNAQATSPVTTQLKALAEQQHIPVVSVTETLPAGEPTFQHWQQDQATALLEALGR